MSGVQGGNGPTDFSNQTAVTEEPFTISKPLQERLVFVYKQQDELFKELGIDVQGPFSNITISEGANSFREQGMSHL